MGKKKGKYKIERTYFRGNPNYGRTTTITDINTGEKKTFMGIINSQKDAEYNFTYKPPKRSGLL